eukprot:8112372-Prorocentrum_lima.AAC.1
MSQSQEAGTAVAEDDYGSELLAPSDPAEQSIKLPAGPARDAEPSAAGDQGVAMPELAPSPPKPNYKGKAEALT